MDRHGAGPPEHACSPDRKFHDGMIRGVLAGGLFVSAPAAAAQDADDFILYDTANGELYYDADGSSAVEAVKFAVLSGKPAIAASDIVVFSAV